jgi:hypothetical protein
MKLSEGDVQSFFLKPFCFWSNLIHFNSHFTTGRASLTTRQTTWLHGVARLMGCQKMNQKKVRKVVCKHLKTEREKREELMCIEVHGFVMCSKRYLIGA